MQTMLIDFVPVLLFFIAFKFFGIYVATTVGIVVTALQVVLTKVLRKKYDKQQLVTLVVFVFFGGLTLYFHDPIFVKWKPTIIFWVFGVVFLGSQFIGAKPLIQRMMQGMVDGQAAGVPLSIWKKLNLTWSLFFIVLGSLNLYVAYAFSTDAWVNFKLYGIMGIFLVFSILQALYLTRYLSETKQQ